MRDIINKIVKEAIAQINEDLELEELNNLSDETRLFDILDSLGTLDLVVELECRLQKEYGRYIQIANDYTMDKDKTDFATLPKLIDYITKRVTDG